jgi:4-aminobutyrate--pyruvate transaminase
MNQPLSSSQVRDAEALLHPCTNAVTLRATGAHKLSYYHLFGGRNHEPEVELAEKIKALVGTLGHGYTYGCHPVAFAVGVKALEIYERIDLLGHARRVAPGFAAHLDRLGQHSLVGEARHLGLVGCLELAPNKSPAGFAQPGKVGARMNQELVERGIISRPIVDTMVFCPPMIITEAEIDEMFAPVEAALDATLGWARAEGHLG